MQGAKFAIPKYGIITYENGEIMYDAIFSPLLFRHVLYHEVFRFKNFILDPKAYFL